MAALLGDSLTNGDLNLDVWQYADDRVTEAAMEDRKRVGYF
ncbi:MAG TPA: hypothetical protein VII51_03020 [Gaiellaceae bacterium]